MRDDALLREFNNFVKPKSLRREVHDECPRTFGATRFKEDQEQRLAGCLQEWT